MKIKKTMNILLIGPSGSGKGTQAELLAKKYNLKHLQSGEILRNIAKKRTGFGKEVNNALKKGFVPPEWIIKITKDEFKKVDSGQGLVLDSFSRLLPEIKMLYRILADYGRKLDYIFLIDISDREAAKRLINRTACGKCQSVIDKSDKTKLICPKCGGRIAKRKDDNLKSIKNRLDDFRNKTSLVIDYVKKNDKLIEINGEQPIEKVFSDIIKYIEN